MGKYEFDFLKILEESLNKGSVPQFIITGMVTKGLMDRVSQYRFIIYSNDHNPAHFHVESRDGRIKAKYAVESFQCISGGNERLDKFVLAWYNNHDNKGKLISEWNRFQKDKK